MAWASRHLRSIGGALVGSALVAATAGSVAAQVPEGGFSSANVEWLKNVSVAGGTITAQYADERLFVVTTKEVQIYDASDPEDPRLVGSIARRVSTAPLQELLGHTAVSRRPDVSGNMLLLSDAGLTGTDVDLYDISDPSDPRLVSSLNVETDSTSSEHFACVLECTWGYGKSGAIIDLRDPANPKQSEKKWDRGLTFALSSFEVDEVANGRVLTASQPMYLLDARAIPTRPMVLAESDGSPQSHGSFQWPAGGRSPLLLTRSASFLPPRCEIRDALRGTSVESAFKTWDASTWKRTGLITGLDDYYVENGTYIDGDPAVSGASPLTSGCGSAVFDAHPDFVDRGLVAFAAYGHGVKLLSVKPSGEVDEIGYFLPYEPHDTVAAYWASDEIVYSIDITRGIDVLRIHR